MSDAAKNMESGNEVDHTHDDLDALKRSVLSSLKNTSAEKEFQTSAKKIVKASLRAFLSDEKDVSAAMKESEIVVMDTAQTTKDPNDILKYGGKQAINISLHLSKDLLKDIPVIPKLKDDKSNDAEVQKATEEFNAIEKKVRENVKLPDGYKFFFAKDTQNERLILRFLPEYENKPNKMATNTNVLKDTFGLKDTEVKLPETVSGAKSVEVSKYFNENGTTKLDDLTEEQAYALTSTIFGKKAADIYMAFGKKYGDPKVIMVREVALAVHEDSLNFITGFSESDINKDPATYTGQKNLGTFQISDERDVVGKYKRCLKKGIQFYKDNVDKSFDGTNLTPGEMDVFTHVGFLFEREGMYPGALKDYADSTISDDRLVELVYHDIQGGAVWAPIGDDVMKMTRYAKRTPGRGKGAFKVVIA